MRLCPKCQTEKDLSEFGTSKNRKDGVSSWCRRCSVLSAKRYASRPGGKAAKAAYDKQYVERNRDRILARQRTKYPEVRSKRIENARRWATENPMARRAIAVAYKAKRRAKCTGGATGREIRKWLEVQLLNCVWCGVDCSADYHIDHVIPLAKGGEHTLINLAIACPTCNVRKNARAPLDFALELESERLAA